MRRENFNNFSENFFMLKFEHPIIFFYILTSLNQSFTNNIKVMKRNNELVEKVNAIINTLPENEAKTLKELVTEYEWATFKEWEDKDSFYQSRVDKMVNDCGFNSKGLAKAMANNHPTLQQSYMRHCLDFIQEMANKTYTDARNEAAVETAKKIMECAKDCSLPFI
jgi:uncharacterized membrane-anchored protein YjiN (DUF445 family)